MCDRWTDRQTHGIWGAGQGPKDLGLWGNVETERDRDRDRGRGTMALPADKDVLPVVPGAVALNYAERAVPPATFA